MRTHNTELQITARTTAHFNRDRHNFVTESVQFCVEHCGRCVYCSSNFLKQTVVITVTEYFKVTVPVGINLTYDMRAMRPNNDDGDTDNVLDESVQGRMVLGVGGMDDNGSAAARNTTSTSSVVCLYQH